MALHAHCFCPEFLVDNINDFMLLNYIKNSGSKMILDNKDVLFTKYMENAKSSQDKVYMLEMIRRELTTKANSIIYVDGVNFKDEKKSLVDIVSLANTTDDRSIVVNEVEGFIDYYEEIRNQKIYLITMDTIHSFCAGYFCGDRVSLSLSKLIKDIMSSLYIMIRYLTTELKENPLNDLLKMQLESRDYKVKDQSREGESLAKKDKGELDIVIEDGQDLFAIIEALRLKSVDKSVINDHYIKLLRNYNPLGVKNTFLITYYYGANFSSWWGKYTEYISTINKDIFQLDELSFTEVKDCTSSYLNIKRLEHFAKIGNENFKCIHIAINIR